ncbi:MAG: hypothetical protein J6I96_05640 [Oscillospiraceae bacterium]|nr:hypothetical protein [Oscillospiraceae bacterium]
MRARYTDKVTRLSKMESRQVSRQAADSAFPAAMGAVLYVLYKYRRWHRDRCVKLYDDVCALLSMPGTVQGSLDDRQVCAYLESRLGIDWEKIKKCVQIEDE